MNYESDDGFRFFRGVIVALSLSAGLALVVTACLAWLT